MNILFNAFSEECKVYCDIARLMEERDDVTVDKYYFLTESTVFHKYISERAPKGKSEIIYMYEVFDLDKEQTIDFQKLKEAENKYGIPNFLLIISADRFYRRFSEEKILRSLQWHIDFYENLFNNYSIDVLISGDVAGLYGGLMHQVAREKFINEFSILTSVYPSRVYVSNNVFLIPNDLEILYNELLERDLKDEELEKARIIVDDYRNKGLKPAAYTIYKSSKTDYIVVFKNVYKKINNYFFKGIKNIYKPLDIIMESVFVQKFRKIIEKNFYGKLFAKPDFNENYIYYPLHFEPEITVDLLSPFNMNQIYLINNIAKCLPINCKLYVKEHPGSIGRRPISYYKKLLGIPRVKLIKTDYDNYELIKHSKCIATISGTTGWEGLILGKPVVTFGIVFFNIMKDSVFFVKDFFTLPHIFRKIVSDFKPNEENILKICYAKYLSTYPGSMIPPSMDKFATSDDNINNLYKVIINEFYKRKNITR